MQVTSFQTHSFPRTLVVLMPALSTLLTVAFVFFFKAAPAAWQSDTVESIAGGVLVLFSALSFLALCRYASEENTQ